MSPLADKLDGIYENIRRWKPAHVVVRTAARITVKALARLRHFEMPPGQPYNWRLLVGGHEPGTTFHIKRILQRGMTAVDVGAHVGYFTRLFARCVGPRGRVYAFEPDRGVYEILARNTRRLPQVVVLRRAVLDSCRTVTLYPSRSSGASSVWQEAARAPTDDPVVVEAVRLDQALAGTQIDLVKIDVEGAEPEVLQSMAGLLPGSPGIVLVVECNPSCLRARGWDERRLLSQIVSLGFGVWTVDERTRALNPIQSAGDLERSLRGAKYVNLLCRRRCGESSM